MPIVGCAVMHDCDNVGKNVSEIVDKECGLLCPRNEISRNVPGSYVLGFCRIDSSINCNFTRTNIIAQQCSKLNNKLTKYPDLILVALGRGRHGKNKKIAAFIVECSCCSNSGRGKLDEIDEYFKVNICSNNGIIFIVLKI